MSKADIDFGPIAQVYPFHEETYAVVKHMIDLKMRSYHELPLPEARAEISRKHEINRGKTYDGTVKDVIVESSTVEEGVLVSVYIPNQKPEVPNIFLYFHGGGLVVNCKESCDAAVKTISELSEAIVVSVEYRLLPNADDPLAPFNDCEAVTRWVLANKTAVGGVADSKVGVGGDRAGGQLASSFVHDLQAQGLDFVVMVYPVTQLDCTVTSCKEFQSTPWIFNTDTMEWMFQLTNPAIPDVENNPRVNPSARKDLELTPPTLMLLVRLDPLRDWGVAFAEKLRAARVPVELEMIEGVPHGFFTMPAIFKSTTLQAYTIIANFMKRFR